MEAQAHRQARVVGDSSVEAGRGAGQLPWYEFAASIFRGKRVLDAGCGLGLGLDILRRSNNEVLGQDLDPRLERPGIIIGSLASIPSRSYDAVTCIDVIEHVEDDRSFAGELCRIARESVFVTTPNWTITRCHWPYHIREYTPQELESLFQPFGGVTLLKGNSSGSTVYPVRHASLYHMANSLRSGLGTAFAARCINKLMPSSWRIHGHNAVLVDVDF
jgi:2-polyprenyl-3-methyl-5-hydroxy-6-metoxy-1,4-benzoquinol methylase